MKYVLERDLGIDVTLVSGDSLEESVAGMSYAKEVEFGKDFATLDFSSFDLILCLDCSNSGMLSSKERGTYVLPGNIRSIQIDHHATNSYYAQMNYVDADMPSACSVLFEMFKHLGVVFDAELSRRLLLGICTDTGFFAYSGNPLAAMKQSVFLIEQGVDYYNEISKPIRLSESLSVKKLFAAIINNVVVNEKMKFAYSSIGLQEAKKLGLNSAELRGGVRALQDIRGMNFVFVLVETDDYIKGSFRSNAGIDVSLFAKSLGGGGHKAAAAFQLPKMLMKEAEKKVLEAIETTGVHRY
jgi:phosphoesterase RecJ-like protein